VFFPVGELLFEPAPPGAEETIVGKSWKKEMQKAARREERLLSQLVARRDRDESMQQQEALARQRRLAAPADYNEATVRMIVAAMGGDACQVQGTRNQLIDQRQLISANIYLITPAV
jgi:hypothetical protein